VVRGEGDFGDNFLWARFAHTLRARYRGVRLVLVTWPGLVSLFAAQSEWDAVYPAGADLRALEALDNRRYIAPHASRWLLREPPGAGAARPNAGRATYVATLGEVGYLLGVETVAEIAPVTPYLAAPPHSIADAVRALPGLRIGVVWAGGQYSPERAARSMPLAALEPLAEIPGVQLVSLQVGPSTSSVATLYGAHELLACPFRDRVWDPDVDGGQPLADFAVTAAAASACDLIVTVDTGVASLAGALGLPTCVMLNAWPAPEWRWAPAAGAAPDTTPWYPTVRTLRQAVAGDWAPVVAAAAAAVRAVSVARSA
jgi:hypothetical protein